MSLSEEESALLKEFSDEKHVVDRLLQDLKTTYRRLREMKKEVKDLLDIDLSMLIETLKIEMEVEKANKLVKLKRRIEWWSVERLHSIEDIKRFWKHEKLKTSRFTYLVTLLYHHIWDVGYNLSAIHRFMEALKKGNKEIHKDQISEAITQIDSRIRGLTQKKIKISNLIHGYEVYNRLRKFRLRVQEFSKIRSYDTPGYAPKKFNPKKHFTLNPTFVDNKNEVVRNETKPYKILKSDEQAFDITLRRLLDYIKDAMKEVNNLLVLIEENTSLLRTIVVSQDSLEYLFKTVSSRRKFLDIAPDKGYVEFFDKRRKEK